MYTDVRLLTMYLRRLFAKALEIRRIHAAFGSKAILPPH